MLFLLYKIDFMRAQVVNSICQARQPLIDDLNDLRCVPVVKMTAAVDPLVGCVGAGLGDSSPLPPATMDSACSISSRNFGWRAIRSE
jgi:hypothetical protein